jgi:lactoylglutathione lyase
MTRLSLIVLRCRDVDPSRSFYEILGLVFAREQHSTGPVHYACEFGSNVLELYPSSGKSTSGLRLGLALSDLDGAVAVLERSGIAVKPLGDGLALVVDPDGHAVEICRERPDARTEPVQKRS